MPSLSFAKCARKRLIFEIVAVSALAMAAPTSLGPGWAQSAGTTARVTEAVDTTKLVMLRGNTHPLARPEFDLGLAPDGLPMERILLVLKRSPEQEKALRQLLDDQQSKGSPNFHHWLSPEEFGQRFGPADPDVQAVTDWLTSEGFEVKRASRGRTVIEFSGTAGTIRSAFHTEIHQYDQNGQTRYANTSDPMIPQALAAVVAGFDSLHSFPKKPLHRVVGKYRRSKATGEVKPLFSYHPPSAPPGSFAFGLGPTDFATIYNVVPLWNGTTAAGKIDGTGQSIAVVGDSNINLSDVSNFRQMFGLPAYSACPATPCLDIILDGPDPGLQAATGSETEADLDVEWSGGVAKGATIKFVVSEDTEATFGTDLSELYVVDNNIAPVMSVSFGECESNLGLAGNLFERGIFEQGAAEGISIFVSSGDSGAAGCDPPPNNPNETAATQGLAVSGLASTPFNVAVGGTDFNQGASNAGTYWSTTNNTTSPPCPTGVSPCQSSALSYIPEMPWDDSCASTATTGNLSGCSGGTSQFDLVGGGGGASIVYTKPTWQTGTPSDGARDMPDVSLFAADGANASFFILCAEDQNAQNSPPGSTTTCDLNSPYSDFLGVGGTSAAAPSMAAIMAMVNQSQRSAGNPDGRQGNANYVFYPLAAQAGASCTSNAATAASPGTCIFYDINNSPSDTTALHNAANNSVACVGGSPDCSSTTAGATGVLTSSTGGTTPAWGNGAGYDLATGLGSVNAANLVNFWKHASFTSTTTAVTSTTPSPVTVTHGTSVNFNVKVSSGSGTPTGDISLIGPSGTPFGIGPFTLLSGSVTASTVMLPGGTYNVVAHYAGDGKFGASDSSPVSVTVNKESSLTFIHMVTFDPFTGVVLNSDAKSAVYGSPYILRTDVTNNLAQPCSTTTPPVPCPTGAVTWTDGGVAPPASDDQNPPAGTVAGNLTLNSQAYAEDIYIQFPAGAHNIAASYAGDASYKNSTTSAADALTISQAPTTITLTGSPTTVSSGGQVTLTAVVSTNSSGLAPGQNVHFLNGTTPITGTISYTPVSGSSAGFAQLTASLVTPFTSSANVTAVFAGDSNYTASPASNAVAITVTSSADYSLTPGTPSPTSIAPGGSSTATITVSPANGFSSAVTFTCAITPVVTQAPPTCSMNPGSSTTSSVMTFSTTAPSATPPLLGPNWTIPGGTAILGGLLLLSMLLAKRRRLKLAFGMLASAALAVALVGCGSSGGGGGGGNPGTPAGNYTITVTGMSGALSHQTSVAVNVQ